MKAFIILAVFTASIASCGAPPPPADTKADEVPAQPTPSVPVVETMPNPQATPVVAVAEAPKALWKDPLTSTYWFIGGLGNVDKALNLCYGDYRIPTYFELYRASLDGLAKFDPRITQVWSLDSAYFDPTDASSKVYYVDLLTSTMVAGDSEDIKGLACIWDPAE